MSDQDKRCGTCQWFEEWHDRYGRCVSLLLQDAKSPYVDPNAQEICYQPKEDEHGI